MIHKLTFGSMFHLFDHILDLRYKIIIKQREQAYKRIEEAKATAKYMDNKVKHYEDILAGLAEDDTNPNNWTTENRPSRH